MTRAPKPLLRSVAPLLALGSAMPVAAQQQAPETFSLPEPTPTPTPAPAGPADERAGVAIPPRAVVTPDAPPLRDTPAPLPSPTPLPLPLPQPTMRPETPPSPARDAPSPSEPEASAPTNGDPIEADPQPVLPQLDQPARPNPDPAASGPTVALGEKVSGWGWFAVFGALLGAVLVGLAYWRRRKPVVLRLAAPRRRANRAVLPNCRPST